MSKEQKRLLKQDAHAQAGIFIRNLRESNLKDLRQQDALKDQLAREFVRWGKNGKDWYSYV